MLRPLTGVKQKIRCAATSDRMESIGDMIFNLAASWQPGPLTTPSSDLRNMTKLLEFAP